MSNINSPLSDSMSKVVSTYDLEPALRNAIEWQAHELAPYFELVAGLAANTFTNDVNGTFSDQLQIGVVNSNGKVVYAQPLSGLESTDFDELQNLAKGDGIFLNKEVPKGYKGVFQQAYVSLLTKSIADAVQNNVSSNNGIKLNVPSFPLRSYQLSSGQSIVIPDPVQDSANYISRSLSLDPNPAMEINLEFSEQSNTKHLNVEVGPEIEPGN